VLPAGESGAPEWCAAGSPSEGKRREAKLVQHRLKLRASVVCVSAAVGATLLSSPPALAAPPEKPEVKAASVRSTTAAFLGVLNPKAKAPGEGGTYQFVYRASKKKECKGAGEILVPASPAVALGGVHEEVSEPVAGLTANTEYAVCLVATNLKSESAVSSPGSFKTAIPPETPETLKAEPVAGTTATLRGVVNPAKPGEVGTYEFFYRQSATECQGEGEKATPAEPTLGKAKEAVSAPVSELLPHTQYAFCLLARNRAEESSLPSPPQTFTTLAQAPTVEEAFATDVASTSATLSAKLNPEGAATSYVFEYARAGGAFTPVPEPEGKGSIAEGTTGVVVGVHVHGLIAHTAYEFRVAVANSAGAVTSQPVAFMTQTAGGEFVLPDNRAWELVSPVDKHGALIEPIMEAGVVQAAAGGGAITYLANAPTEAEPQGNSNEVQVLSTRGPGGWGSLDIAIPHNEANGKTGGQGQEYRFFSEDLSLGIVEPLNNSFVPQLSGEASEATPYLRSDYPPGQPTTPCSTSCYRPLVTGAPGDENVPPGTVFGGRGLPEPSGGVEFLGATPDASHVVLGSQVALTPGAGEGAPSLYEWAGGKLTLASVPPKGGGAGGNPNLGHGNEIARNAISADGSRVIWSEENGGNLYMRDIAKAETVQLDVAEAKCGASCQSGGGRFQIASVDGSKVFFTDTHRLTASAGESGKADLYECEIVEGVGGEPECKLSDLTPLTSGESADVQSSVLGASNDGSWVYFVARGVLTAVPNSAGETALSGQPNLYVRHGGTTQLIAVPSSGDRHDWGADDLGLSLANMPVRVAPHGEWLAFMSERSLTGYDNRDASNGQPVAEVYLYSASAHRVVCASCDPSGARPIGVEYEKLEPGSGGLVGGPRGIWPGTALVAANVPGWIQYTNTRARYQSRYLSDGGRLFFNSRDALVPQDENGTQDVYQYDPLGVGGCTTASTTFTERSSGCVDLISSGTSAQESAFLDASESGGDVFFLTAAKLSPQDTDTSFDVYDAHECTGASPCLPPAAQPPLPCNAGDSCKPAPSPQPEIFGMPASGTFSGPGNLTPVPPPAGKTAAQSRAEGLAKALKVCRRKHNRQLRKACERNAQKRYGPAKKASRSSRARRARSATNEPRTSS
jgi:hypothetical protein